MEKNKYITFSEHSV